MWSKIPPLKSGEYLIRLLPYLAPLGRCPIHIDKRSFQLTKTGVGHYSFDSFPEMEFWYGVE